MEMHFFDLMKQTNSIFGALKNRYSFPLYTKYTSNFMNYCAKQAICNRNCTHKKANKQTSTHTPM